MNRRSFLKLSLASATAVMVPSVLTEAIAGVTPVRYKGWECNIDKYKDTSCWRVIWSKGENLTSTVFDGDDPMSKIMEVSRMALDQKIRRMKRRVA